MPQGKRAAQFTQVRDYDSQEAGQQAEEHGVEESQERRQVSPLAQVKQKQVYQGEEKAFRRS